MRFIMKRIASIAVITALLATPGAAQAKKKKHKTNDYICDMTLTMTPDTGRAEVYEFENVSFSQVEGTGVLNGVYASHGTFATFNGRVTNGQWQLTLEYGDRTQGEETRVFSGRDTGENSNTEHNARGTYSILEDSRDTGTGGAFTLHAVCTPD